MRLLVEPSDTVYRNIGDQAMLRVALERIAGLWPEARIQVFTEDADELPRPSSNIEPLLASGRRIWLSRGWLPSRRLRGPMQRWLRVSQPRLAYHALVRWGGLTTAEVRQLDEFFEAVSQADLLIVTGMGGITSAFPSFAFELLEIVRCAQHFGAKTAMVGQGLGPVETARLRRVMTNAFRRLDLLALREGRAGLPLLRALGVPLDRVIVTGDDAIELAFQNGAVAPGRGIGVNMRHASYSGVQLADIENVRMTLVRLSMELEAPLVGVPISRVRGEEDANTIALLTGNEHDFAGELTNIRTVEELLEQLGLCRILVAGSYHAAVFALSCGIPTVALARSAYYTDKFLGLAEMFGTGCWVVPLDDSRVVERLYASASAAWGAAEQLRDPLLAAAQRQFRAGVAAYDRLKELVA
jgi:polysaccharide pyruvyl transferase WcaK-like protein